MPLSTERPVNRSHPLFNPVQDPATAFDPSLPIPSTLPPPSPPLPNSHPSNTYQAEAVPSEPKISFCAPKISTYQYLICVGKNIRVESGIRWEGKGEDRPVVKPHCSLYIGTSHQPFGPILVTGTLLPSSSKITPQPLPFHEIQNEMKGINIRL